MHALYTAFAVILPVSLGLGLVYLSSIGRIGTDTALMGTILIVVLIAAAVIARDSAERSAFGDETDLEP